MDAKTKYHCEARAKIIKALAHSSRIFMIEELGKGERSVYALTEMVGADVSTVSKHLSVLKNAGLVTSDRRGQQVFYTLRVPCILNFFSCVETVLQANAMEHNALVE
ncbi:MAG: metalloregulator ArsR/SmtB family transcription factor [Desulfuromonadaceae bacterium]|jgi:ArsR family transcriptional regulator|nr:metalloregulator ArsR/SmtB family transcription factor [Desulfuromonas sp.]MDY0184618.1 metalloregulator ArsR/SmtB family transcription factor [Desulfuromonadaceae bacterium]